MPRSRRIAFDGEGSVQEPGLCMARLDGGVVVRGTLCQQGCPMSGVALTVHRQEAGVEHTVTYQSNSRPRTLT